MTVSIDSIVQNGANSWELTWSSDLVDALFYVYQDGRLIDTTAANSRSFSVPAGESLVVEVLDNADIKPEAAFPGKLTLGWYRVADAARYKIMELVAGNWLQRVSIDDTAQGYYQWKTRFLEDSAEHQFEVIPVGNNGNEGAALAFSVLMVRHPDPPLVSFSYDSVSGVVTVS